MIEVKTYNCQIDRYTKENNKENQILNVSDSKKEIKTVLGEEKVVNGSDSKIIQFTQRKKIKRTKSAGIF